MDESVDEAKAAADPSQDQLLTDVYVSYLDLVASQHFSVSQGKPTDMLTS